MIGSRAVLRSLAIVWVAITLAFGLMPAVWAQYSIPDCYVAAVNGKFPGEEYAASRDQLYKKNSQQWSAEIAGLTAQQLAGYIDVFCANLTITDTGKDADGTQHFEAAWTSVDDYLAFIGQRRGSNGGGSNSGGSTTNNGSGSTDSSGKTTGTIGGSKNAGANVAFVPSENVVFQTSFDDLPAQIELRDENGDALEPALQVQAGGSLLHVSADAVRLIDLTGADDWTDYAVEARVRLKNGGLMLSARMADNHCSSYSAYLDPTKHTANLGIFDDHCKSTTFDSEDDVNINANQWTTVRFEVIADQLSLFVNGEFILIANDTTYTKGFPAFILFPAAGKTATLDIDSFQVSALHAPPETLTDYAASPGVAVAELQSLGQVPAGGSLIFTEDHAYYKGSGNWFQPLATSAPKTDIVMAGELTFTSGTSDDYEDCGLMARIIMKGNTAAQEIEVGFDNDGYLDVYEYADPDSDDGTVYYTADTPFTPGNTYHVLFTLIGPQLVIYVDGKRTLMVNNLVERAGSYGIGLTGKSAKSGCDGHKVWVYGFR